MSRVCLVLVVLLGCTSPNENKACSEGTCKDPAFPYCDVEGSVSGENGTCIAVTCTPGEILTCLGDDALTCNATGEAYEHVACELGCKTMPMPHCGYIEPRYLPTVCDTLANESSLEVGNTASFDPNLDSNCNGGLVPQTGAPDICIVRYGTISIPAGVTLTIAGKEESRELAGRPIAFVSDGALSIEGILDISAHGVVNGPGGGVTTSGGQPGGASYTTHVAGGGAGGQTVGGAGGSYTADGGGMNGGAATADPALLSALIGGATGFRQSSMTIGIGSGGGGGAATLISCRGTVTVAGTINAGGGGGSAGAYLPFPGAGLPGFGGGAGGYVAIQAKKISIAGDVFANGGGGGAGMQSNQAVGFAGADGSLSSTVPATGGQTQNGGGRGGAGGVRTIVPGAGGNPTTSPATAGGGGGSVGFLQTYTPEGITPDLGGAQTSPAFQPNATIKTR